MRELLLVGTGSFIGGIFRYLLSRFIQVGFLALFPFGTLAINIIGCFFIGIVFALAGKEFINNEWRMFLTVGLLGGFTTFSAFSNETILLLKGGQFGYAGIYVTASVLIGLLATYIGYLIINQLFN